jgi:nucleoside-diphosphate-sugar epimerase
MLRPARVYGPGDLTLLPLFKLVKKSRFVYLGKMDAKMMPIYVGDMVEAFVRTMELSLPTGSVYNIAGNKVITSKEFMDTVARVIGKKIPSFSIPMTLVKFIAILCENIFALFDRDPPISLKKLRFFTHSEEYSTKKAKDELGFEATVSLEDGLKLLYQWYKEKKLIKKK